MKSVNVNFENLTNEERQQLLKLVAKSQNSIQLHDVEIGKMFKISDFEFIKFADKDGLTTAVTRDAVFSSEFGKNNNFAESKVYDRLKKEILPQIAEHVGYENISNFYTDLTTLDGLKPYKPFEAQISLPTFDFYRENVEIFDKYKLDCWWWLATPDSAQPHYEPNWIRCVTPYGILSSRSYNNYSGVRPFLKFVSSIFVSCED